MRVTLILLTLSAQCLFRPALATGQTGATASVTRRRLDPESVSRSLCIGPEEESRACVCTPVDLQDKCSHVCVSSGCVSGYVADPCDCSCFYHCVKAGDQWTAIQQCCNLCEVWDDYPKTCVRNSSDPDCTFTPLTNPPGVCPLSSGSSKTKFFLGGVEMSCGPNTEFSQAECACVHAPSALALEGLITCITFDGPRPYGAKYVLVDQVEIETDPGICGVSGNCGYFDRRKEAHLEIPFFAGNQFSKFAYSFWYRRNPNNFGKMGLVNNGNCEMEPTISLVSGGPGYNCGQLITEDGYFMKSLYNPGSKMTAPPVVHQDGGVKYATGAPTKKIHGRNDITIGTWNVRTLRAAGKLKELTHEMERCRWNLLGLAEMRWKSFGETSTEEGHKVYFSGKNDKHEQGVGFLVHKDIVNTVMGCRPISSRLITIRLKATPFNMTVIQVYAPTSDYDDSEVEDFYGQLQEVIEETPKKDSLIVLGDWNAKVGKDAHTNWQDICRHFCNVETNERGHRFLEFVMYNELTLINTFGPHKTSRRWTWHSQDGKHHNHFDYIFVKRRFHTGVNIVRTRSFPGADIGSDHDLLMTNFHIRLKRISKPKPTRKKLI
ncbi:hypothetical protein LSAT2_023805 [Lamellibrachia satsuma]|nr:hypothetical protein LSAT2_023805 [Lamellibrachia satsuma]